MGKETPFIECPQWVQQALLWLKRYWPIRQAIWWIVMALGLSIVCGMCALLWRMITAWQCDDDESFRNYGFIFVALLGGITTAGFATWRGFIADQENRTNRQRLEAEERGRIVDRIGTATTNMRANHGDDPQKPNIQARIEGIYALESISQDNPNYHIRMMDNITEYIRENAPKDSNRETPRADIKIAIDVLARRLADEARIEQENAKDYKLDLSNTNLQGVVVQEGGNFNNARFESAQLQKANFGEAQLAGANFKDAQLQKADFWYAQLQGAHFWGAQLEGAYFGKARLKGARFGEAQLQWANFEGAHLQKADFWCAELQGAKFIDVQLQGIDFTVAQLQGAMFKDNDLRKTINLEQDQLQDFFGDGSVILPDNLTPPNHWPKATPDWDDYEAKYKQWLKATYPDLYKQHYGQ